MKRKSTSHPQLFSTGWGWIMKNMHRDIWKINLQYWKRESNIFVRLKSRNNFINLKSCTFKYLTDHHKKYGSSKKVINMEHFYQKWSILRWELWCEGRKMMSFIWYLIRQGLVLFSRRFSKFLSMRKRFLLNLLRSLHLGNHICTTIGRDQWDCHRCFSCVKRFINMLNLKERTKVMFFNR